MFDSRLVTSIVNAQIKSEYMAITSDTPDLPGNVFQATHDVAFETALEEAFAAGQAVAYEDSAKLAEGFLTDNGGIADAIRMRAKKVTDYNHEVIDRDHG